jgi:hypothetical protein
MCDLLLMFVYSFETFENSTATFTYKNIEKYDPF